MSNNPIIYNRQPYVKQDINNGALKFVNAMPQKDLTSDGESSFEMGRKIYTKTNQPFQSENVLNTKKWVGGNRDSSSITTRLKNNTIGKGSINTDTKQTLSFTTYKDVNTVNNALTRVRAGGAMVPPKVRASKHPTTNYSITASPSIKYGFSPFSPRTTVSKSNNYTGTVDPKTHTYLYI
jgi:hypothetical protein